MIWGPFARAFIALCEGIGVVAYLLGVRRAVALDGLRRAFPEKSAAERRRIARASYAQLGRSLAEVILLRRASPEQVERLVRYGDDWRVYDDVIRAGGRGGVCAIAHYGNFELLARAVRRKGVPLTLIARGLRDAFGRRVVAARSGAGVAHLPEKGATPGALAALRAGGVLAIAVDQNMRPSRGIFVDFFGTEACTTPAAAVYALRARAPLVACFLVRRPDGTHQVVVRGPFTTGEQGRAAVEDLTRQLTAVVEEMVREHPDHWFWVHRRWKTRPAASAG